MDNLQKFNFVHLLDENLLYHAEIKNKFCNVTWLDNDKEKKVVTYPQNIAMEYIKKGLWIVKENIGKEVI